MPGRSETFEPVPNKRLKRAHGGKHEGAGIEDFRIVLREAAHCPRHRHAAIGVDVHLAYAMTNAALDFLNRHAPGLRHFAAMRIDHVLQFLRHRTGSVHDEVSVRQTAVDRLYPVHREDFPIGRASEFISPV